MMMIHFFLRWKMFQDDAFFVDFQCIVLKLSVSDCFGFDSKDDVPFKGVSLHIFHTICVSNTVDPYATQYVMFIYEEKYSI